MRTGLEVTGADSQGTTVELPPPLPEMSPLPEVVDERMLSR